MTRGAEEAVTSDRAQSLYRDMVFARRLDEQAVALQRQGVFPAYVPMTGQEGAQIGSAAAMDPQRDFAFPTYREMGVALTLGVDMVGYLASHRALWHGGLYNPMESHFGAVNAIVGGPVPHAVGWALGAMLDGTNGCAVAYFGDGASSQGDVHEAMNFAGIFEAPVVFFCQNNQWAISVPVDRQVAGGSVAARAEGYGMPGVRVDGNDVLAVYEATRRALERARTGGGPSVIEAHTYRVGPHSTSDDPGRYRDAEEERRWRGNDPIARLRRSLERDGIGGTEFFTEVDEAAERLVAEIRDGVTRAPEPDGSDMFSFVYREPTEALREQQRNWRQEADLE